MLIRLCRRTSRILLPASWSQVVDHVYTGVPTGRCGFHLIVDFERQRNIGANHASLPRCLFVVYENLFHSSPPLVSDITDAVVFGTGTDTFPIAPSFLRRQGAEPRNFSFGVPNEASPIVGWRCPLPRGRSGVSEYCVYVFGSDVHDGGTLTGTFTTDNTFSTLVDFNITTSPGVGLGFTYTTVTAGSGSTSLPAILVLSTASLSEILQVTFDGGLTATGAPIRSERLTVSNRRGPTRDETSWRGRPSLLLLPCQNLPRSRFSASDSSVSASYAGCAAKLEPILPGARRFKGLRSAGPLHFGVA